MVFNRERRRRAIPPPSGRLTVAILLACSAIFGGAGSVQAELARDIDRQDRQVTQTRAELNTLRDELEGIERREARLTTQVRTLEREQAELRERDQRLRTDIDQTRDRLDQLGNDLARALDIAYRVNEQALLQILLGDLDAQQSERQLRYLEALIEPAAAELEAWRQARESLESLRQRLAEQNRALEDNARALDEQRQALAQTREEQQTRVAALDRRLENEQTQLADLRERQARLEAEMARIERERKQREAEARARAEREAAEQARREAERKAKMEAQREAEREAAARPEPEPEPPPEPPPPVKPVEPEPARIAAADFPDSGPIPVEGRVTRRYGAALGIGDLKSEGITFATDPGMPVRAVSEGEVVFADWMSSLGQLVIVRHAQGFLSLYAHNAALLVKEGDRVGRGQVLATAGRTGGRAEPGLYFEVRKGNKPVNPESWSAFTQARRGS